MSHRLREFAVAVMGGRDFVFCCGNPFRLKSIRVLASACGKWPAESARSHRLLLAGACLVSTGIISAPHWSVTASPP